MWKQLLYSEIDEKLNKVLILSLINPHSFIFFNMDANWLIMKNDKGKFVSSLIISFNGTYFPSLMIEKMGTITTDEKAM